MNKAHWVLLGIVAILVIAFLPKAISEKPANNQEMLDLQSILYAAHISSKPIQIESECAGIKVWTYGWLNNGHECTSDIQCNTMIDDGVSYQIADRSYCCLSGLAKGTCVENYEKWIEITGG